MLPELTTARLSLRPVSAEDLPLLVALNSDPEVMAFVLGRPATAAETESEWERRLGHQTDAGRGLGDWLGFEDSAFVGWWSASSFAQRPEVAGLGYRLARSAWGRGLATEGVRATVPQAFADRDVRRVVASTMAVNAGSRRVLEKVGMTHTSSWPSTRLGAGPEVVEELAYELTRVAWEASTSKSRDSGPGCER